MTVIAAGSTLFSGHSGPVYSVAFSADGAILASGGDDATLRLWDPGSGEERRRLTGHAGTVRSVAFSPDGAMLASGGDDGMARLWEPGTGRERARLAGHAGMVWSVAFSPDGALLATGGADSKILVWDIRAGQERAQLVGHEGMVWSVAVSPDGAMLASGGNDGTVRLWDLSAGQEGARLAGHTEAVRTVAFSPDGTALASAGSDKTIRLWDLGAGQERARLTGHTGPVRSVAFSPDGTTLASGGNDGTLRLWDASTGYERVGLPGHTGLIWSVAFSPRGSILASGGADETVRLWDAVFQPGSVQARLLAGVRSDSPSAKDLLGIRGDVETLADLIAATDTQPPLAIALIGDWGIGKSSLMLQVQDRINLLAKISQENPGLSAFAATVRQVRFNAWHYSDDHLWAGLISHLFQTLAAPDDHNRQTGRTETPYAGQSKDGRADLAFIHEEQAELRHKVAAARQKSTRLAEELEALDLMAPASGAVTGLRSPLYVARLVRIAARVTVHHIRTSLSVLFLWAVLAAAAFTAWHFLGSKPGAAVSAVAAITAPTVLVLQAVRHLTGHLRSTLGDAQREAQQKTDSLKERQLLIDAAARLAAFHEQTSAQSAYKDHRGLLGQIHQDLMQLSENLAHARAEWAASRSATPPPLQRIVLYIDDLDRCPPRRVVEVLEAVHLMLALDLFIVVVAVDARWLIRSLNYYHHELFQPANGHADLANTDFTGPATPVDYLDKIFQIPYTLIPPAAAATAAYLRAILPEPGPNTRGARRSRNPGTGEPPGADKRKNASAFDDMSTPEQMPAASRSQKTGQNPGSGTPTLRSSATSEQAASVLAEPGLRPQSLQLTKAEVEFMARLGGLLPTPRAAKRMANLYRLVRISIADDQLAAFTAHDETGPYQVVQILLAILTGSPTIAGQVFQHILRTPGDADFLSALSSCDVDGSEATGEIREKLLTISAQAPFPVKAAEYRPWCPVLARYSFHTRSLA